MIDTQAKPRPYIGLLVLAALLGLITAAITFLFIALVHVVTSFIWERAALLSGLPPAVWTILVCTVGGLLVGLLVKAFGVSSPRSCRSSAGVGGLTIGAPRESS